MNDNKSTFICSVFPAKIYVFKIDPFEIIKNISKEPNISKELKGVSINSLSSCQGHKFIAFSGLPADPHFDTRSIMVLDTEIENPNIFKHAFQAHILSHRVTPDAVFIAFYDHIEIWNYMGMMKCSIDTAVNVHAPLDISANFQYAAFAGTHNLDLCHYSILSAQQYQFHAADNPVSIVRFSGDPSFFATTSSAGHTIKIWNASTAECMAKLKRGNTATVIYSFDFSPNNKFVVVLTKDAILHFFALKVSSKSPTYRAFHKINLGEVAISQMTWFDNNKIAIVMMDGKLLMLTLDDNCQEVGRQNIRYMQRIQEEYPEDFV